MTKRHRQTMQCHEKNIPKILEETPMLWKLSQTSFGYYEKCEYIQLTGWKKLSGALGFF